MTVYYMPDCPGPWERVRTSEVELGDPVPERGGVVDMSTGRYLADDENLDLDDPFGEPSDQERLEAAWMVATAAESSWPVERRQSALNTVRELAHGSSDLTDRLVALAADEPKEKIELSYYRNSHGELFHLPERDQRSPTRSFTDGLDLRDGPTDEEKRKWDDEYLSPVVRYQRECAEMNAQRQTGSSRADLQEFVLRAKADEPHRWRDVSGETEADVAAEIQRQRDAGERGFRCVSNADRAAEFQQLEREREMERRVADREAADVRERNAEFFGRLSQELPDGPAGRSR